MSTLTRRDLLRTSLLLGGTVCAPHFWAPGARAATTRVQSPPDQYFLVVGGGGALIQSVIGISEVPPAASAPQSAHPMITRPVITPGLITPAPQGAFLPPQPNQFQFALGWQPSQALANWVAGAVNHAAGRQDGSLVVTDYNLRVKMVHAWTGGSISQVVWPGCNVYAKDLVSPVVTAHAVTLQSRPGDGSPIASGYVTRARVWSRSNYRVTSNANIDFSRVATVSDLTFAPASYGGAVTLVLPERWVAPFSAALQAGGALVPGQSTDITIQFLRPDMATVLASVTLRNCLVTSVTQLSTVQIVYGVAMTYADASLGILPA
jgi:hypothetical protein